MAREHMWEESLWVDSEVLTVVCEHTIGGNPRGSVWVQRMAGDDDEGIPVGSIGV